MTRVTQAIRIGENEIRERFIRSPGPGGQNVNKVATAVQLRFDARSSPSLPPDVRERLLRIAGRRATADGVVLIEARRFRTRERNREDARERLAALVAAAAEPVTPRVETRPTGGSRERRLDEKRRRGDIKRVRRAIPSIE